jgi:hypothetical protein
MKKPKTVKTYYFNGFTHQQMVDHLNLHYPIKIERGEDLINRIYARYPLINKTEISMIVKAVFQSLRDLLVLGKVLNFNNLFFDTKLHFFDYHKKGHILPFLKVKISTPPPLRKHDNG